MSGKVIDLEEARALRMPDWSLCEVRPGDGVVEFRVGREWYVLTPAAARSLGAVLFGAADGVEGR